MGVNNRTLRRQRRSAAASSKGSHKAKNGTVQHQVEEETEAAAAAAGSTPASTAASQDDQPHAEAAAGLSLRAGSASSQAHGLSSLTCSASGSIIAPDTTNGGTTSKQRTPGSTGVEAGAGTLQQCPDGSVLDAMLCDAAFMAGKGDAQADSSAVCEDATTTGGIKGGTAAPAGWGLTGSNSGNSWRQQFPVERMRAAREGSPSLQQQDQQDGGEQGNSGTMPTLLNQAAPAALCGSPSLCELEFMTDMVLDIGLADAEAEFPMDQLLAPLVAPPPPPATPTAAAARAAAAAASVAIAAANGAAALLPSSRHEHTGSPAAAGAVAAAPVKHDSSSAGGAVEAMVPVAGSGSCSPANPRSKGQDSSPGHCNSRQLARHVAAAVAGMPGLPLPNGHTLNHVEELPAAELLQWQQVLKLEAKVWPAGSQQRKQSLAAAEVVGMLATYKTGSAEQQQQQQVVAKAEPEVASVQPPEQQQQQWRLPHLHELQLQPRLPPKGNSEQLLQYLLGGPTAAAAGATGPSNAHTASPQLQGSFATSTSVSAASSSCCARCGCSRCTCMSHAGGRADRLAATATTGTLSSSHITSAQAGILHSQQQQQQRKRRQEPSVEVDLSMLDTSIVSVPSDADHAQRLPLLPQHAVRSSSKQHQAQGDSAEDSAIHQQRRRSTDWAVGAAGAASSKKAGRLKMTPSLQPAPHPSRQQVSEQQLREQQQQLQAMQALHMAQLHTTLQQQPQQQQQQMDAMALAAVQQQQLQQSLQQQRQLLQQQKPAQNLTPEQLEEWKVDQELQLLLLEAQMQVSSSGEAEAGQAAAAGAGTTAPASNTVMSNCFDAVSQGMVQAYVQPSNHSPGNNLNAALQAFGFMGVGQQEQQQQQLVQAQQLMLQQDMLQQHMLQQQMQQIGWGGAGLLTPAAAPMAGVCGASVSAAGAAATCWNDSQALGLDTALQIAQGKRSVDRGLCVLYMYASYKCYPVRHSRCQRHMRPQGFLRQR